MITLWQIDSKFDQRALVRWSSFFFLLFCVLLRRGCNLQWLPFKRRGTSWNNLSRLVCGQHRLLRHNFRWSSAEVVIFSFIALPFQSLREQWFGNQVPSDGEFRLNFSCAYQLHSFQHQPFNRFCRSPLFSHFLWIFISFCRVLFIGWVVYHLMLNMFTLWKTTKSNTYLRSTLQCFVQIRDLLWQLIHLVSFFKPWSAVNQSFFPLLLSFECSL